MIWLLVCKYILVLWIVVCEVCFYHGNTGERWRMYNHTTVRNLWVKQKKIDSCCWCVNCSVCKRSSGDPRMSWPVHTAQVNLDRGRPEHLLQWGDTVKTRVKTVQIEHRIVPFYTGILPRVLRSGMDGYELLSVRWTLSHCKPYYCVMDQWCTDTKRGDAADMAKTVCLRNRHQKVLSMSVLDCRRKKFSFASMRWIWVHVLSMSYGKIMRIGWSVILGLTAWVRIVQNHSAADPYYVTFVIRVF